MRAYLLNRSVVCFAALLLMSCAVYATPSITFIKQDAGCMGAANGKAKVVMTGFQGPYYYLWSNGQTTVEATGLLAGTYTVTVNYGTSSDTTVSIKIEELTCPIGPGHSFTPNGDGLHETWALDNVQFYPNFLVIVYNRWGQKVFEQKGEYVPWDGTSDGAKVPDASYYYIIIPDQDHKDEGILKGSVTIIR
jgi:gliding motility-associated-like protein